ncbi:hypothetical protein DSECCO2_587190 [anaerobic digester metagenome]
MFGEKGIVPVFSKLASIFGVDVFQIGIDRFQIGIVMQQGLGSLGADPLYPGNIVRTVPHQCQIIDELLGAYLISGKNSIFIQGDVLHGVVEQHAII